MLWTVASARRATVTRAREDGASAAAIDGTLCCVSAAAWIVALFAVVTAGSALSRRVSLPAPLLLTVVGLLASFVPGVPNVRLSPDIVLIGFLPPLLYAASLQLSLVDVRLNRGPILSLSVGLVLATTLVTGVVVWWVLPVPLAAAIALGAVVAPPDAVAATAVARRVGMPRRMVTILEGESLVNDATALVSLRTAITALTVSVSAWRVGVDFVATATGGAAVGLGMALVIGRVRKVITDNVTDTAVSLVTPFAAYLVAEELHCSGVLAVVCAGVLLGHRRYLMQSASSRIFEKTIWRTIEFVLENTVFFFIGLQVRRIVTDASDSGLPASQVVLACVSVAATVVLIRPAWVFGYAYLPRLVKRLVRPRATRSTRLPVAVPAGISWAGMRGVVTLAAAFVLPTSTPYRSVLILLALVVVGATLLLQGATLPIVLKRLGLRGPDRAEDVLQLATVQQQVSAAGLELLDQVVGPHDDEAVVERLRLRSQERSFALWERLGGVDETPSQAYARLRQQMIDAERAELLRIRDLGTVPHEVLRVALGAIDIEESILDMGESLDLRDREEDLVPNRHESACDHLAGAAERATPRTPEGCEECLRDGTDWVHLRLCLDCGHVGCCDSSVGLHATGHFRDTGHPVMRSFEMGEAWRWCYVDEIVG
jgi:Na+/H+ antiporter